MTKNFYFFFKKKTLPGPAVVAAASPAFASPAEVAVVAGAEVDGPVGVVGHGGLKGSTTRDFSKIRKKVLFCNFTHDCLIGDPVKLHASLQEEVLVLVHPSRPIAAVQDTHLFF